MNNTQSYRLTQLKPLSELPKVLTQAIIEMADHHHERHIKAASIVLYGLISLNEPVCMLTVRDLNDLIEKAPSRLISTPFKVWDPYAPKDQKSVYSEMLSYLTRSGYVTVFRAGKGRRPLFVALTNPQWRPHLNPISIETKQFLLKKFDIDLNGGLFD